MIYASRIGILCFLAVVMGAALVACGITPTPIPTAHPTDETVQEGSSSIDVHIKQGNDYVAAGDFASAATEFEAAVALEPANVSARSNLGVVYYRLGRLDEAIEQWQQAIEIAPTDADLYSNLAAAYVQKGELEVALEHYQTAVESDPDLAEAHFGLGVVNSQLNRIEEAIQAFEKFQELDTGQDSMASDLAKEYLEQLKGQQ